MRRLGSVQQKVACVFQTEVKEEKSRKRDGQVSLRTRRSFIHKRLFAVSNGLLTSNGNHRLHYIYLINRTCVRPSFSSSECGSLLDMVHVALLAACVRVMLVYDAVSGEDSAA